MKRVMSLLVVMVVGSMAFAQQSKEKSRVPNELVPWKIIWHEEFSARKVNPKNWSAVQRGSADWNRYMSPLPELTVIEKGNLVLTGIKTAAGSGDTAKYATGGLESRGKFSFKYGKIAIRAKLLSAQGAWPALWLLPDMPNRKWPDQGEIDIMEHLNHDDSIYQTAHSSYTVVHGIKDNPPHGGKGAIERDGYNVYSVEWSPEKIVWLINEVPTFEYPRLDTPDAIAKEQWPFDEPFYIILSQQLGGTGTWVGEIDDAQLPVKMWIDYIRVYQL